MKAIVYTEYGPPEVLRLAEVATPVPGDDQILLRVRAASINPLEWHYMRGTPYIVRVQAGWRKPKVQRLGLDVAGQVEAVGKNLKQFRAGDEVFGACRGALAEYVCTTGKALTPKPPHLTWEQAAAVPVAALTALQGLRDKGRIRPGQNVLINGAAGGVGTFAVQIARVLGAEVTGVCSTSNVAMVRSLGAHRVIDYTQEDFTQGEHRYDLILDMIGNHSWPTVRHRLTPHGRLVLVGGPDDGRLLGPLTDWLKVAIVSLFASQKVIPFIASLDRENLMELSGLLEAGTVKPVIDRTYSLDAVPDAIRYLEEGHARGKVVITMTRRDDA